MEQARLKRAGKINHMAQTLLKKGAYCMIRQKNLLYPMQKVVLLEIFRDLQPKETMRRMH